LRVEPAVHTAGIELAEVVVVAGNCMPAAGAFAVVIVVAFAAEMPVVALVGPPAAVFAGPSAVRLVGTFVAGCSDQRTDSLAALLG